MLSEEVAQELLALEESLLDASVRKDSDYIKKILAPDFMEIGASGIVYNRQMIIETLLKEPAISDDIKIEDFSARIIAENLALVTYRIQSSRPSLRGSIWKNAESGWQIFFHQGTYAA